MSANSVFQQLWDKAQCTFSTKLNELAPFSEREQQFLPLAPLQPSIYVSILTG